MPSFVYYSNMKYIVACSGGPDSMALLDMLRKENNEVVVAHVNYQKRDTAFRDEKIVEQYCKKFNIEYRVRKVIYDHSYNFEAWARDVRYSFFEEICDEFHTKDIYVAHHKDDHIETYLFQKQRGMLCDWYGLKNGMNRNGYIVHRPLLSYTKKDLVDYCEKNKILYGIDETNLSDSYTRNKIRHSIIDRLSSLEKDELCLEIQKENQLLIKKNKEIKDFFGAFDLNLMLNKEDNWRYLDYYLNQIIGHHFSKKYCVDLCDKLRKDILLEIENFYLERFHNQLYCVEIKKAVCDMFDEVGYDQFETYEFKKAGKTIEGFTVSEKDFPICVRTVRNSDYINLRIGNKNVHRFFVDRKIPKHLRKSWLVVENVREEVIFVPGIGCDVEHFSVNPNVFMVQYSLIFKRGNDND